MKLELTPFEWKLYHLLQIRNRMVNIHEHFLNLPENEDPEDEYDMKSIVREYAIIQIANFIDLKRVIEKDSLLSKKRHLKECLEPFAAPITSRENTIKILRNSFYAHIGNDKNTFYGHMEEVIEDKFPKNPEEVVFLAGCVIAYSEFFRFNFQKEWDEMSRKFEEYRPLVKKEPRRTYEEIMGEIKEKAKGVVSCLKQHSLETGQQP